MNVQIDRDRLRMEIEKRFGNAKTSGLTRLEDASRDSEGKTTIAAKTVYNLLNGQGWRNDTVERLCEILNIHPSEIIMFRNGGDDDTHAPPQSVKRRKEQVAV